MGVRHLAAHCWKAYAVTDDGETRIEKRGPHRIGAGVPACRLIRRLRTAVSRPPSRVTQADQVARKSSRIVASSSGFSSVT